VIYGVLILAAGAAIGFGIKIATDPKPKAPPPWSAFKPTATDTKAVQQIANYVQGQYKQADGKALTEVRGGPLVMGSQEIQLAVRKDAVSNTVAAVNGQSVEYNMCGNANSCSVPKGVSPQRAGVLTRREGLPARAAHVQVRADRRQRRRADAGRSSRRRRRVRSFIRRSDVQQDLGTRTMDLPGRRPRSTIVSQREAEMIAKRTDPYIYSWILANVDNTPTLVVNPISLDVKDSIPAAGSG